jgi:DNA-binding winged helix-turn-helix (wHTH) protein
MKVRFADCMLDTEARCLFRGTGEIHLSPKAFELLKVLVDNRPRALSKAELLEGVWPSVFVSDASLARVVNEVRAAIGDRARPAHIVRTVHGYGYAFAADIEADIEDNKLRHADAGPPGRPACWFIWRRRVFALSEGEHIAGREPDVSISLDSAKVSRHHARVLVRGAITTIEDLDSKNGTFVRGSRISAPTALEPGDAVRIGPFTLTFRVARGPTRTETETIPV